MFDSQCDLAALVYQKHEDPDGVLRGFARAIGERGCRAVGLIQHGHRIESGSLSAVLIHTGMQVRLFQDLGAGATGCKLDVGRLLDAAEQVARGLDEGADIVIINRYGKQERAGRGLAHLITHALDRDIPVVIAVPEHRFADWIAFSGGMSVKLPCREDAVLAWWQSIASRAPVTQPRRIQNTFCEALK
jgi:hypothetical protein